jgi:hypothetical protein
LFKKIVKKEMQSVPYEAELVAQFAMVASHPPARQLLIASALRSLSDAVENQRLPINHPEFHDVCRLLLLSVSGRHMARLGVSEFPSVPEVFLREFAPILATMIAEDHHGLVMTSLDQDTLVNILLARPIEAENDGRLRRLKPDASPLARVLTMAYIIDCIKSCLFDRALQLVLVLLRLDPHTVVEERSFVASLAAAVVQARGLGQSEAHKLTQFMVALSSYSSFAHVQLLTMIKGLKQLPETMVHQILRSAVRFFFFFFFVQFNVINVFIERKRTSGRWRQDHD